MQFLEDGVQTVVYVTELLLAFSLKFVNLSNQNVHPRAFSLYKTGPIQAWHPIYGM